MYVIDTCAVIGHIQYCQFARCFLTLNYLPIRGEYFQVSPDFIGFYIQDSRCRVREYIDFILVVLQEYRNDAAVFELAVKISLLESVVTDTV